MKIRVQKSLPAGQKVTGRVMAEALEEVIKAEEFETIGTFDLDSVDNTVEHSDVAITVDVELTEIITEELVREVIEAIIDSMIEIISAKV